MPTLYLLIGYPGAGKTTTAKAIEAVTGAARLSSDEYRLKLFKHPSFSQAEHDELYERLDAATAALMREGRDIVYDANLNRRRHRDEKYALAREHGYRTVLLWITTPRELSKRRRVEDTDHHHLVPGHEDPASMFDRIARIIEVPGPDEPHLEVDGTIVTDEHVAGLLRDAG